MTSSREPLREALRHPNVAAFLKVIDQGEHGKNAHSPDRYRTMYGGGMFDAPPWEHPRKPVKAGAWTSTAAGRPQFLAKTWDGLVAKYGFEDFSPQCQDEGAVALILGRKALDDVIAGRLEAAIGKCNKEWASLPGSPYGQPTMTMADAHIVYKAWGGTLEEPKAAPQETHELDDWDFDPDSLATEHYGDTNMAPIILPLIQMAATLIPQLAAQFGSGSEVANRNIAAAMVLGEEIVKATNTPNLQAAVEKMQAEPEALAAAKAAVAQVYPELFEVGGGVEAARKAAQSPEFPFWKNGAFWISFILIVMPFMLLVDVFYVHPTQYDANLRTQIVTAVLMVIGMVGSFWLGTSFGSQRKTNLLANKE